MSAAPWLTVIEGDAPLILSQPHTGTSIPPDLMTRFVSPALARRDADWWVDKLYDFGQSLGATVVHTAISRSVIDVNRDPLGGLLYPGQQETGLCPATTFDGTPLYRRGEEITEPEIAERRERYFMPYHAALATQIDRLRKKHGKVVLYDCHSIRSVIPHLFEGELPVFNIGTNSGKSCDPALAAKVAETCATSPFSSILNGRFKGGWITRSYGNPDLGVHAVQMELSCRGYMDEPAEPSLPGTWPTPYSDARVAPMRESLKQVIDACLAFAKDT